MKFKVGDRVVEQIKGKRALHKPSLGTVSALTTMQDGKEMCLVTWDGLYFEVLVPEKDLLLIQEPGDLLKGLLDVQKG